MFEKGEIKSIQKHRIFCYLGQYKQLRPFVGKFVRSPGAERFYALVSDFDCTTGNVEDIKIITCGS